MESKAQLIKRARIYDAQERASDYPIGHPGGPTGWRKPRAPPATGAAAKLRRLRKLYPELWRRVMEGELTVGKAATMAGFHTPKKPKPDRGNNSITRLQEMELWLGASHRGGSAFVDDEHRRKAWFENRDRLMSYWACNGHRPFAWWKYESPVPWPGFGLAKSTLWSAGLLETSEARALEESWQREFDRSRAPNFTFDDGPRGVLTGWAAHVAHLVYCDIPAALAEQWAAAPEAA
jgi:hypothetical protein